MQKVIYMGTHATAQFVTTNKSQMCIKHFDEQRDILFIHVVVL